MVKVVPGNREVLYCSLLGRWLHARLPSACTYTVIQPESDLWYAFVNVHTPCPSVGGLGKPPRSPGCSVM